MCLASFVTGALLVFTSFDEQQNMTVDSLRGSIEVIQSEAESWQTQELNDDDRAVKFDEQLHAANVAHAELESHFTQRVEQQVGEEGHARQLVEQLGVIAVSLSDLEAQRTSLRKTPAELIAATEQILKQTTPLKRQSPTTLLRLRIVEIGLPLLLSLVSIWLTVGYPLTESRCLEIKKLLEVKRAAHTE